MKRCTICGHLNDDSSTVCEMCKSPLTEIPDEGSSLQGAGGVIELSEKPERRAEDAPRQTRQASAGAARAQGSAADQAGGGARQPGRQARTPGQTQGQGRPQGRAAGSGQMPAQGQRRPERRDYPGGQGRPAGAPYARTAPQGQGRPQGRAAGSGQMPAQGQGRPERRDYPGGQGRPAGAPYARTAPQGRSPYPQGRGGQPGRTPFNEPGQPVMGATVQRRQGGGQVRRAVPSRQGLYGRQMMEKARTMLHGPVFVLLAVLNTVFTITSIASVFLQELSFTEMFGVLTRLDIPSELMTYANRIMSFLSNLGSGAVAISLISRLPGLLLCAGLWVLLITSRSKEAMSGAGFVLEKIYLIIRMIVICVVLAVCLILSVTFVVSAWVAGTQGTKIVAAVFLVLVIVITMMIIMYYFCLLHTVSVCRRNAIQGEEAGKASAYAAVLTMIAALFSLIGLLSAIVNVEIAGIVSYVCKIGWMVLLGIWILSYRGKMSGEQEE